jgi:hypothetical protein
MAASTTKQFNGQEVSVFLAVGTHTWEPTPESGSFQDEVFAIMRAHGITRLDTSRSYVCLPKALALHPGYI